MSPSPPRVPYPAGSSRSDWSGASARAAKDVSASAMYSPPRSSQAPPDFEHAWLKE